MYSTFRQEQTSENIIYKIRKKLKKINGSLWKDTILFFVFQKDFAPLSWKKKIFDFNLIW